MKVVHFGAGNIGRGFIGKLLADAGCSVLFVDVNQTVLDALNARGTYPVRVVGEASREEVVSNVAAIHSADPELAARIAESDLVTTAVGPVLLARIAPSIAAGLAIRVERGVTTPCNVIACENMVRGTTALKGFVLEHLPVALHEQVLANVGFADSAVDRIVPPAPGGETDPLAVTVEEFSEWIVDRTQLKAWSASIAGMELTDNLMAFVERKLFTLNTGHAITAYLGVLHQHETVAQAIANPDILAVVRAAMEESGEVLIRRYGFDRDKHASYISKILTRFANPWLNDNVYRVAREPIRKLGRADRLVRPLLGTLEFETGHANLVQGIGAALCYVNPADPQAQDLQDSLQANGVVATLERYTEGTLPASVCAEVEQVWHQVKARFC